MTINKLTLQITSSEGQGMYNPGAGKFFLLKSQITFSALQQAIQSLVTTCLCSCTAPAALVRETDDSVCSGVLLSHKKEQSYNLKKVEIKSTLLVDVSVFPFSILMNHLVSPSL